MDPTTVFFAVLAGFICYQLYAVLGRRDGHEPEEQDEPLERPTVEAAAEEVPEYEVSNFEEEHPEWAKPILAVYPDFDEKEFLNGAKSAYEMIVVAFSGDALSSVKPYIVPSVYKAFESAVTAREAASQTSEVQFVGIEKAEVTDARVENNQVKITVSFFSDQIRVLRDDKGEVIDGDPNRIDLVKDFWTFARSVNSSDPNWQLVATGGVEPS